MCSLNIFSGYGFFNFRIHIEQCFGTLLKVKKNSKIFLPECIFLFVVKMDYLTVLRPYIFEIFETLGLGHTEYIYHKAFEVILKDLGLKYESERIIPIKFRGRQIGFVRADLIVENQFVIELKCINITKQNTQESVNQCLMYMKETGIPNGMVVMFPCRDEDLLIYPINL